MRAVIVGMGDVGKEIAEALARRKDNQLVLIDMDEHLCEQLSTSVDAMVLCGDGTNPRLLDEAHVAESDALIATTGSDPLNTVIAMLGRQMGVQRIMVKLNDVWLRPACHQIGVTKVVAPKVSAAADIVSALYGFDRLEGSLFVRGGLHMVDLPAGSAKGKKAGELSLPKGVRLAAIVRGDQALVAEDATRIEENDVLLAVITSEDVMPALIQSLQA